MDDAAPILWLLADLLFLLVLVEFFWMAWPLGQVKRNTRIMVSQLDLLLRGNGVSADRRKHAIDSGQSGLEYYPEHD